MEHLNSDGSPKYSNQLVGSSSPYLLQHAHNPVNWRPWGNESLQLAKKEDKPILLSVGYSTCYWCHVMEREVFNNPEIARQMNEYFINIKVDREERPDLDEIYMAARNIMTNRGGWPNTVFITPDLKPFFAGGTYSADRKYGRNSFPEIIESINHSWKTKRDSINKSADNMGRKMEAYFSPTQKGAASFSINKAMINDLIEYSKRSHDSLSGGFFNMPKFPNEERLLFLIDACRYNKKDKTILNIITKSLDMMAAGGIYDHLGGGFHRYATDKDWLVPHFEKMLYNQALLALCYAEAFEITGKSYYEYIARSVLDFVAQKMTGSGGGFYSAYDAETEAIEGAYYVWRENDIKKLLSHGAAKIFFETFELADVPVFPGHGQPDGKVIHARKPIDALAKGRGVPYESLQEDLDKILGKLLLEREKREPPLLDTKVISGWNGLMIDAFARVGAILGEPHYVGMAENAANFILSNMLAKDGRLYRTWRQGKKSINGFLEDYAYFIRGLLSIYKTTREEKWLISAIDIINKADDLFLDRRNIKNGVGGFFTNEKADDLIVNIKTADDSATPSGNGVMVHNLVDLALLTEGTDFAGDIWEERIDQTINAFGERIMNYPQAHVSIIHGRMRLLNANPDYASTLPIVGTDFSAEDHMEMSKSLSSAHYVKISAGLDNRHIKPGNSFTVNVVLSIAPGWHINGNKTEVKGLIPTSISINGRNIAGSEAIYPKENAAIRQDNFGDLKVYEDKVSIKVKSTLSPRLSAGDIENISVLISFQVCNEDTCLSPANIIREIPIVVAS